ncbi:MAG: Brp/Blh family beta-carotene 15,15'-dioxygenase [Bacteroidetes bacterium]|nr:Brp/Blh family beta-carotene 15,15'-dioxygenase [Fibrella sp.]
MTISVLTTLRHAVQRSPTYLTIVAGLLLVSYQQWVGPLPILTQLAFCVGLLLIAGIPHGALDHLIEQERSIRQGKPFSLPFFILKYLLLIAAYGVGWLFFPVLSLVVFLLISAWHFGETDLEHAPGTALWSLARFASGSFVLAFILLTHTTETTPILARIVQNDPQSLQIWQGAASQPAGVLVGLAALTLVLTATAYRRQPIPVDGGRLGRLGLVLLLTWPLPLLPAFVLYFGGWHALSSFGTIRSYLRVSAFSRQSVWKLWLQSMPLTIAAFGFLGACTIVWYRYTPQFDPLPSLFILLSTITLPHIQVMNKLNNYISRL